MEEDVRWVLLKCPVKQALENQLILNGLLFFLLQEGISIPRLTRQVCPFRSRGNKVTFAFSLSLAKDCVCDVTCIQDRISYQLIRIDSCSKWCSRKEIHANSLVPDAIPNAARSTGARPNAARSTHTLPRKNGSPRVYCSLLLESTSVESTLDWILCRT